MTTQTTLFDKRFLGKHAGQIMSDPTTALVELVANSWDAYATRVSIEWPNKDSRTPFRIIDDGKGMTRQQFEKRWCTLDYNRAEYQGSKANPPSELTDALPRQVYGQNGRGRHAAFLFSSPYTVRTWRDGMEVTFRVSQGDSTPIVIDLINERDDIPGHGTEIIGESVVPSSLPPNDVRAVLSTRFLLDPSFNVLVDGTQVTFNDIPEDSINQFDVTIPGHGVATIITIDAQRPDRTTKQHGIAWWVNKRLVGEANWQDFEGKFIDGRTEEAKRYSFVVFADFLKPNPEWSGFTKDDTTFTATRKLVVEAIRNVIADLLKERRKETKKKVAAAHRNTVKKLPKLGQDRWNSMLTSLIEKCPTIGEKQIDQVMDLLANMELAESQYSFLEKLHKFSPQDVDDWNNILDEWTVKTAKAALDEISRRLKLIEEIRLKTEDPKTNEVQELQPLFEKSLWIFGPEFESIEFTSNRGMSTVVRRLFNAEDSGTLNRPDFVVLPESSIGFYARPRYDEESNEDGTEALVIIELKKPGVPLGSEEKNQAWKYIKELIQKGYVDNLTMVRGFVLGDRIESGEGGIRTEDNNVRIKPMLYSTFVGQAEKRMLNLHRKLADAPFMRTVLEEEKLQQTTQADFIEDIQENAST